MIEHTGKVSRASSLCREIIRKLAEVGVGGTLKIGINNLFFKTGKLSFNQQAVHPFDLQYGTDTSGIIKPGALDIPRKRMLHAVQYQSAIVEVFLGILKDLPIPYQEFIFIDLGSGKGRALLLASRFPFKEIIGVELSESLHRIACRNIQIFNDEQQKCHKISSFWGDVVNYEIPNENIVFYLFNPFDGHIIQLVLNNIENHIHRYHRKIYIAYLKPVFRELFDRAKFLVIQKETEKYVIYKNII